LLLDALLSGIVSSHTIAAGSRGDNRIEGGTWQPDPGPAEPGARTAETKDAPPEERVRQCPAFAARRDQACSAFTRPARRDILRLAVFL
jgi:hypothetical protein